MRSRTMMGKTAAYRLEARKAFIPKDAEEKTIEGIGQVFRYEIKGKPAAIGFAGTAGKPTFHHSFKSVEARDAFIERWIHTLQERAQARKKRQAEKKEDTHSLEVGHVLYNSWGWEQTNVDFYEVVRVVSDKTVVVRQIKNSTTVDGFMSGTTVPLMGCFVDDAPELQRRAGRHGVRIDDVRGNAKVWTGRPVRSSWYA